MNKRSKNMLVFILSTSMILANMMPVFAEELIDETTYYSANDYSTVNSEEMAHLDWVDVGYPDLPPNDRGEGYGLPNPFFIINDSEKGTTVSFSRILNKPDSDSNVVLVSFTNGYNEDMAIAAVNKNAKSLRFYNEGSVTASNNDPKHRMGIKGYDGHGEEFLVNKNMFNLTDKELNNLTLGELKEDELTHNLYYEPIEGFGIYNRGYHTFDPDTGEEFKLYLKISMDIVHDTYNPLDETDTTPQTWIRVRYTGVEKKEVVGSEVVDSEVVPEWQKDGFKRELLNDNGDYIQVLSENSFNGKKLKPVISVSLDGQEYSTENKKLSVKYKNNKNVGTCTVTLKKIKKNKSATALIKGKSITFEITPITVSDNNLQTTIKNGTVKKVKVLTGAKYKTVKKKMWNLNGNVLTFSGNYKGSVSLNEIS